MRLTHKLLDDLFSQCSFNTLERMGFNPYRYGSEDIEYALEKIHKYWNKLLFIDKIEVFRSIDINEEDLINCVNDKTLIGSILQQ